MIESFSQCLQAWMKDTSRSIASVAADAHLKSKTTVARILKDQSTYQSYEKLYKALSSNTEIDEKWKSRFEHVLRAEKVGLGQYAMFETIRQKLLEPKACIRPVHPAEPMTILIVGCPWQKTYEFIEQCLAQNQTVIYHYLTLNELLDNPPVLAGLMACLRMTVIRRLLSRMSDYWPPGSAGTLCSRRSRIPVRNGSPSAAEMISAGSGSSPRGMCSENTRAC